MSQKTMFLNFKKFLNQAAFNKSELKQHDSAKTQILLPNSELLITPQLPHYGILYLFKPQDDSFIVSQFGYKHITIENEFLLPHTTVSRVRFGPFVKTIVGFSMPINDTHTRLFVKLYRNYWVKHPPDQTETNLLFSGLRSLWGNIVQMVGDILMEYVLYETIKEDQAILENLDALPENKGGKFNLKYDKFPHMYRMLYGKMIKKNKSENSTH